jgi:hypothetical protein
MKDVKLTFNRYGNTTIYLSVALVSLSILMLEIGLARIFSVMFESHYVFLVISLAILGLGLGGVFVHMRMAKSPEQNTEHIYRYIYLSSGFMAISILLMVN